jgi:eukaryotic-like serine/threonine-protein kinase
MDRLVSYERLSETDSRAPRFASVFVTDEHGIQVSAAFDDKSSGDSIGVNRSYRTYFHGGPEDLEETAQVTPTPPHIERPHLSAAFLSQTQQIWKVAVSTPIYRDVDGRKTFAGVLVLTVAIGEFEISKSAVSDAHDRFAVLVDGRAGDEHGTILQHPLFLDILQRQPKVDADLFDPQYRVPPDAVNGRLVQSYTDPLGTHPKGPSTIAGGSPLQPRSCCLAARTATIRTPTWSSSFSPITNRSSPRPAPWETSSSATTFGCSPSCSR